MNPYELIANSDAIYLDACAFVKIDTKQEPGSDLTRFLLYFSTVPIFSSFVGFGEFFSVVGKKKTQDVIGAEGYLLCCRQLMIDFDMKKIQCAEPVEEKVKFIQLAKKLLHTHGDLGGGDVWHLMAALNLQSKMPKTTFVSFDSDLVGAATAEGLNAVNALLLDSGKLGEQLQVSNKLVGE